MKQRRFFNVLLLNVSRRCFPVNVKRIQLGGGSTVEQMQKKKKKKNLEFDLS